LFRTLLPAPVFGVETIAQLVPFQCALSVCAAPVAVLEKPTVQISVAETALTAPKMPMPAGLGLATMFQEELQALSALEVSGVEGSEAPVYAAMGAWCSNVG
jgi:hypothetical protein